MERDAVTAGVEPIGGLFSTAEIKILICYILTSINEPVPGNTLANTLHYEGIANCFEVNDCIASLCKSGQLESVDVKEDTYIITESGRNIAETLKTSLPFSVKDRAYTAAFKMLSRFKHAKDTDFKITHEDGKTYITCSALDNNRLFVSVKLLVPDEEQAMMIKDKFLNDPAKIYSGIIELITK